MCPLLLIIPYKCAKQKRFDYYNLDIPTIVTLSHEEEEEDNANYFVL